MIRLNSDGSKDTSFDAGTIFDIRTKYHSMVKYINIQSDGKLLLVGAFTKIQNGTDNGLIRLNSDGSKDSSFSLGTGFDRTVTSIVQQTDGKIIVGGGFSSFQGINQNFLLRLNRDGNIDSSFNIGTGFDDAVLSLALQPDGKILVAGGFTTYQGSTQNRLIRLNLDGSKDNSFDIGTGFDSNICSIALQSDGKILIGSRYAYRPLFTRLNPDGSQDRTFNIGTGFNNFSDIETITLQKDGKILVGGNFIKFNDITQSRLIRLNSDGSKDPAFKIGNGFERKIGMSDNCGVHSIVLQTDGKILIGGTFTSYQGIVQNNLIRLNADGSKDRSFDIKTGFGENVDVRCITLESNGQLFVGGIFTSYQGNKQNALIHLNSDGSIDNSFDIGTGFKENSYIPSIVLQTDGKIILGGTFTSYRGSSNSSNLIRLYGNYNTISKENK